MMTAESMLSKRPVLGIANGDFIFHPYAIFVPYSPNHLPCLTKSLINSRAAAVIRNQHFVMDTNTVQKLVHAETQAWSVA